MNRISYCLISILVIIACGISPVCAEERKVGEYQVKALFLYNFINFVDWPADSSFNASPTINVCIYGDDPFDDALDDIRSETVRGKRVAVKHVRPYEEPRGCHILFIPASEKYRTASIIRSIRETGVLTVADTEESVRQGAVIGFFIEQKKVRFAVNVEAVRRAGLKISAKLLKLARIIKSPDN